MPAKITHRNKLRLRPSPASAQKLAERAVKAIRDRCRAGRSLRGQNFARYSDSYAAYRIKNSKGTRVDLRFTGGMLDSIRVNGMGIDDKRAVISIGAGEGRSGRGATWREVAGYLHYGTRYMPARPFMGLTRAEHRELLRNVFDKVLVVV